MIIGIWVYVGISVIVFIWLSEHFYLEEKGTKERHYMDENWKIMVIWGIIAIEWIITIPLFVMPIIRKGGHK